MSPLRRNSVLVWTLGTGYLNRFLSGGCYNNSKTMRASGGIPGYDLIGSENRGVFARYIQCPTILSDDRYPSCGVGIKLSPHTRPGSYIVSD